MKWHITGYGCYKLNGKHIFPFLNSCKSSGIEFKNLFSENGSMFLEIRDAEFEKCRTAAAKFDIELVQCGSFGLISRIKAFKRRKTFVIAFAVMFAVFCMNFCFVSKITVSGNQTLTRNQVLDILADSGVEYGTFAFFANQHEIQQKMMESCNRLSWAWVEIKGTHAFVEIREKIPKPDIFNSNFACNVVAVKDGVVKRAIASGGILYARPGDYVRSGDLLIGGVYDSSEHAPVRFVHASGEVLAQTFYTAESDYECSYIKYEKNEKTKVACGIRIGNFALEKETDGENILLINDGEKKLKIFGNFYLPLAFTKKEYCEIIETKHKLSDSQAEQLALDELYARLKLAIPDGAVIDNTEKEVSKNPDGTIHVKLTMECTEDIGAELPIEFTQE